MFQKIIFLIRSLDLGGAERQLVELAKGLQGRGYQTLVVTFYQGSAFEKDLSEAGVSIKSLHKRGRWDIFFFLWRLLHLIKKEKPDIIHGILPVSNILITIFKPLFFRSRIVWGVRASNMDLTRYDWMARLIFRIECFLARFADLIIVNSTAGRDYHKTHGYPEKKMIVIPNGIDTERFRPNAELRERLRIEWGIKKEEKLIGLVARLDPMKDYPTFLKAAALFAEEREDIRFACVGDGPESYKLELQRFLNGNRFQDKLIWAGARRDMPAVYNALDILTTTSLFGEGFPNVIGEAMACGVPCVVTDSGDSKWIVEGTGIVVPAGNAEKLAQAWQAMITRVEKQKRFLQERARNRIEEQFSVETLIRRTERVIMAIP